MVPRPLAAARAMRSRTCADVIQPCLFSFTERPRKEEKRETGNEVELLVVFLVCSWWRSRLR